MKINTYILILCSTLLALCTITHAADYPVKPVRVVAGFPAGSAVDIVARMVSQKLSETYAQQFIVDARPGAGSNIAAAFAAKAPADAAAILLPAPGRASTINCCA